MKDKHAILAAMRQYGGSFVRDLAALWYIADADNRAKIESTWADVFARYAEFVPDTDTAVS